MVGRFELVGEAVVRVRFLFAGWDGGAYDAGHVCVCVCVCVDGDVCG